MKRQKDKFYPSVFFDFIGNFDSMKSKTPREDVENVAETTHYRWRILNLPSSSL